MADNGESGMNYDNIFIRMLSRVGDAMLLSILLCFRASRLLRSAQHLLRFTIQR